MALPSTTAAAAAAATPFPLDLLPELCVALQHGMPTLPGDVTRLWAALRCLDPDPAKSNFVQCPPDAGKEWYPCGVDFVKLASERDTKLMKTKVDLAVRACNCRDLYMAYYHACRLGNLALVVHLLETDETAVLIRDTRNMYDRGLRTAAGNGHLHVVKYHYQHHAPYKDNLVMVARVCVVSACSGRRGLDVIKYLESEFRARNMDMCELVEMGAGLAMAVSQNNCRLVSYLVVNMNVPVTQEMVDEAQGLEHWGVLNILCS